MLGCICRSHQENCQKKERSIASRLEHEQEGFVNVYLRKQVINLLVEKHRDYGVKPWIKKESEQCWKNIGDDPDLQRKWLERRLLHSEGMFPASKDLRNTIFSDDCKPNLTKLMVRRAEVQQEASEDDQNIYELTHTTTYPWQEALSKTDNVTQKILTKRKLDWDLEYEEE
eukprot:gnl/MRDRNA2_/MRDRNA2_223101_c0_seq1.p1 gnl/MRDRNA2_/MRDRNA2_223101_c0~~gnl/MRDRNA2_/MRDRNA2_223101_c0_seq1.p1  ORF type:complete len:171 (+),score=28.57 gnl/MRDRNA2_/MRDRNA2_223101_c0_seq1:279-791(+)